jgi:hypothetical protein
MYTVYVKLKSKFVIPNSLLAAALSAVTESTLLLMMIIQKEGMMDALNWIKKLFINLI